MKFRECSKLNWIASRDVLHLTKENGSLEIDRKSGCKIQISIVPHSILNTHGRVHGQNKVRYYTLHHTYNIHICVMCNVYSQSDEMYETSLYIGRFECWNI